MVLTGTSNVTGKITFTETSDGAILIEGQVVGLTEGKHGFHVHALGDLSNGCTSTGAHFNPENVSVWCGEVVGFLCFEFHQGLMVLPVLT